MRLFHDFERTHEGSYDLNESAFSFFNRSAADVPAGARVLCERWFDDYSNDASATEIKRFRSSFRSKRGTQDYAAWFELLMHQILVRLGFSVDIHPVPPATMHTPDFTATSVQQAGRPNGSRILMEATVVSPKSGPFARSRFEADAQRKLAQLELTNFVVFVDSVTGKLDKFLRKHQLFGPFREVLGMYDPDGVQRVLDTDGYDARPTPTIRINGWELTVSPWPKSPDRRTPTKGQVLSWPDGAAEDATCVPQARKEIKTRSRKYGPLGDPLILAINPSNPGKFDLKTHGHETLFGNGGIWNERRSPDRAPAVVLFLNNAHPYDLLNAQACLYVNPSVDPAELPPALLRLPHVHGPDGSIRVEDKSVASILETN